MVTVVIADTLRLMGSPVKKSKKSGGKGSVAGPQMKSVLPEVGKLGSNHAVNVSKTTMHPVEIRERKGPSQGVMLKCVPQERIP